MKKKKKPTSKHEIIMDYEQAMETIIRIEENPSFFGLKKTDVPCIVVDEHGEYEIRIGNKDVG